MSRHTARQRAIEILFSREFHGENDIQYKEEEILEEPAEETMTDVADPVGAAADQEYCDYLVTTTLAHKDEFDSIINELAQGWDISQMNRADLNIMRLALCELTYPQEALAPSIVIDEAIVLAKEFSGQKSARFVNGILGTYVRKRDE